MTTFKKPLVGIVVGSSTDLAVAAEAEKVLNEFGVPHWITVASAHRSPARVRNFVRSSERAGARVFIAAAGGSAALPGVVASETVRPVIGVPVESPSLKGLDSLLSVAQMPAGVPVACVAVGPAGARNAGLLAVAILAVGDSALSRKLVQYRKRQAGRIRQNVRLLTARRGGKKWGKVFVG